MSTIANGCRPGGRGTVTASVRPAATVTSCRPAGDVTVPSELMTLTLAVAAAAGRGEQQADRETAGGRVPRHHALLGDRGGRGGERADPRAGHQHARHDRHVRGQLEPGRRRPQRAERHRGGRAGRGLHRDASRTAGTRPPGCRRPPSPARRPARERSRTAAPRCSPPSGRGSPGWSTARPPAAARRRCPSRRSPRPRRRPDRARLHLHGDRLGAAHVRGDVLLDDLVRGDRDGVGEPVLLAGVGQDVHVDAGRDGPRCSSGTAGRPALPDPRTTCRSSGASSSPGPCPTSPPAPPRTPRPSGRLPPPRCRPRRPPRRGDRGRRAGLGDGNRRGRALLPSTRLLADVVCCRRRRALPRPAWPGLARRARRARRGPRSAWRSRPRRHPPRPLPPTMRGRLRRHRDHGDMRRARARRRRRARPRDRRHGGGLAGRDRGPARAPAWSTGRTRRPGEREQHRAEEREAAHQDSPSRPERSAGRATGSASRACSPGASGVPAWPHRRCGAPAHRSRRSRGGRRPRALAAGRMESGLGPGLGLGPVRGLSHDGLGRVRRLGRGTQAQPSARPP